MLGASSVGGFVISLLLRIVWGIIGPSKAWKQALKYIIVTAIKLIIGPITVLLSMCGGKLVFLYLVIRIVAKSISHVMK